MNGIMDYWAMLNTLVIMFALGLDERESQPGHSTGKLVGMALGYNLLIPATALLIPRALGWFSGDTLAAMALCVAASGGTSSGAFVSSVQGSSTMASRLIVLLLGISLLAVALFSRLEWITLGPLSLGTLATYLVLITLTPLWAGKLARRFFPAQATHWQPRLERLGSLLVILLVLALAFRYGREILTGPVEPLLAAAVLVALFTVPPLLERTVAVRRTVVLVTLIRNLTLVLSILAVLPQAATLVPTVLAFGLFMYLTAGVLVWRWRPAV